MATLNDSARRLADAASTRSSCAARAPSCRRVVPEHTWWAADFTTCRWAAPLPEPADRGGVHDPRPGAHRRAMSTSTKPLVLRDGTIIRGLRVRSRVDGRRDRRRRERRGAASQLAIDDGALAARRARARRPPGPDRAARHRLLRHAARRERLEPHRARQRLPVPRRGRRREPRATRAARMSTS